MAFLTDSQTFGKVAANKLKAEASSYNDFPQVRDGVLSALTHFCHQSEDFAKVIAESDKTFTSCMKAVLKDHGNCLSDIEAYRRAVSFYFENADVSFEMQIHLPSDAAKSKPAVVLNLFDIF